MSDDPGAFDSLLAAVTAAPHSASADQIAQLLRGQPDLLTQFERAYDRASDGLSVLGPSLDSVRAATSQRSDGIADRALIDGIVRDLLGQTRTWSTDGHTRPQLQAERSDGDLMAQRTREALAVHPNVRPQVTGDSLIRDMPEGASSILLTYLAQSMSPAITPQDRHASYQRFRQGLDILDLDELTYEMIAQNVGTMGYWLPKLTAAASQSELRIPRTTIAQVPLQLLQLTRIEYGTINGTTHEIVNRWAQQAFGLQPDGDYFIKTGTFSSKFDFRNARVRDGEIPELGDYLLFVHQQALSMASPLNPVVMYGAGTTVEWVVREFIDAAPGTPTIYHGLPLRCEFRVFVDCSSNEILSIVPYWEPETMKHRFSQMADRDDPNNRHDMVTYLVAEPELKRRFEELKPRVERAVSKLLPALDLPGQWSLDIMANEDSLWAIDMSPAHTSTFYESVPKRLRRAPEPEQWLPELNHPAGT